MAVIIEDDAYAIMLDYHERITVTIAKLKEKISPMQSL
jgi:hypothetical protein